jgi:hypothetical protein
LKFPTSESFAPLLPELRTKRAELLVSISALKTDCAVIRSRLQAATPNIGNQHENSVRKLLGKPVLSEALSDHDQLRANQKEIEVLSAAVSVLDKEILKQTREASDKLIESVKSEIVRLGSAFANAFADLREKHLEYDDFLDSLENVGASVGQFRLKPNGLDHPKQPSGNYYYGLDEFVRCGFFSQSTLQKVFN